MLLIYNSLVTPGSFQPTLAISTSTGSPVPLNVSACVLPSWKLYNNNYIDRVGALTGWSGWKVWQELENTTVGYSWPVVLPLSLTTTHWNFSLWMKDSVHCLIPNPNHFVLRCPCGYQVAVMSFICHITHMSHEHMESDLRLPKISQCSY